MTIFNIKKINLEEQAILSHEIDTLLDLNDSDQEVLSEVVRSYLSNMRSGTSKVKKMSEISGTTAKPFKQKGTGNARQGSKRSVQMRGGRTCFGPSGNQNYNKKISKKLLKKALNISLINKIKQDNLLSFSNFENLKIKTSFVADTLSKSSIKRGLFIVDKNSNSIGSLLKSIKNLATIEAVDVKSINAHMVVNFDKIIVQDILLDNLIRV